MLPQAGHDREQAAAADRTLAGFVSRVDLALSYRMAQGPLGSINDGLDRQYLQAAS